jgi:DNA adenine methylase
VGRFECSDICEPLIALWQVVKDDPGGLVAEYGKHWRMLRLHGAVYYREMRREFNLSNDPHLLFFLLRTCRAGHVRFNQAGDFNGSLLGARPGMAPERVQALALNWHRRLALKDVSFSVRDYRQITTTEGDLLYLDPPYETGEGRHYSGKIDFGELFGWLRKQKSDHLLSLNGFVGDENRMLDVPADLYDRHRLLDNGDDPFDRLEGRLPRLVTESLYIKRRFPVQVATSAPLLPEPDTKAPKKDSKSAEIRSLLEMEPDLSGPEVVLRLAERGIEVDANLVRVVKHNARRANQWESRWCEAVCHEVESRLDSMITEHGKTGLPFADEVRLTHDELMTLAELVGSGVSEDHLLHLALALWVVQYARRTGQGTGMIEAEIGRRSQGSETVSFLVPPYPPVSHLTDEEGARLEGG